MYTIGPINYGPPCSQHEKVKFVSFWCRQDIFRLVYSRSKIFVRTSNTLQMIGGGIYNSLFILRSSVCGTDICSAYFVCRLLCDHRLFRTLIFRGTEISLFLSICRLLRRRARRSRSINFKTKSNSLLLSNPLCGVQTCMLLCSHLPITLLPW